MGYRSGFYLNKTMMHFSKTKEKDGHADGKNVTADSKLERENYLDCGSEIGWV